NASTHRQWIVRHALRNQIKEGHPRALALFGFRAATNIELQSADISPAKVRTGASVNFSVTITNSAAKPQALLVDFQVHFVKANGTTRAKVFKLTQTNLDAGASVSIGKRISLAPMTTRKLYSGHHQIDLLINGQPYPLGSFELEAELQR
ncbi:MAG: DNA alkylation repair protein, partial [Pseudohongiella sp.]